MELKWLKKPLIITGKILLGIVLFVATYFLFALFLGLLPVNARFLPAEGGVTIYVLSNGVHTDIVVPTISEEIDWRQTIDPAAFRADVRQAPYLGIGWGDKGFYLETPTWAELKPSIAFRAAFLPSPTAMHVTYHLQTPQVDDKCHPIRISRAQYRQLIDYIQRSFERQDGIPMLIAGSGYGPTDNFFEAIGAYNLVKTCNMWVVCGLKEIGVRTAVWSPFDKAIFYQLRSF